MEEVYDEGIAIDVSFTLRLPARATYDEIKAWVSFEVHESGSISAHNPITSDIEALPRSVRISPRCAPLARRQTAGASDAR